MSLTSAGILVMAFLLISFCSGTFVLFLFYTKARSFFKNGKKRLK
ncbi:hypothetical protein CHCC20335_1408 [Bacillus paralicheniformis]|nr:hypothetical protein CHCC20335_1408 [Bacillus paralicheniformis]